MTNYIIYDFVKRVKTITTQSQRKGSITGNSRGKLRENHTFVRKFLISDYL